MLIAESRGSVRRLTLDRPEVRNAFNDELIAALTQEFRGTAPGTRAILLSANGPAFCGGGDLNWMRRAADYTPEQNVADAMLLADLFTAIVECPAFVIARVHGAAFGGGCGLVAAADFAVAIPAAKFSFSEVKLGLIPATISPFVVDKIGRGHARALFGSGEVFDGERAFQIGLVHALVDEAELDTRIDAVLRSVLSSGPDAVAASKRLASESPIPLEEAARRLASARASDEGREGFGAFLEKRRASFVEDLP